MSLDCLRFGRFQVGTYTVYDQPWRVSREKDRQFEHTTPSADGTRPDHAGLSARHGVGKITASAEQALVKGSAVRFATVQAKQVSEMPLAGRNWSNL